MRVLTTCLVVAYLLVLAVPAPAQWKPLTEDEQRVVTQAIDSGVTFLKRAQAVNGDWPRRDANHTVGYTALPGLTLLECGVPANDPQILKAARLVRHLAPKLDSTYEVALAILFLDRLNNANDRGLIQTLATRLLGGQTITGGWGYKCPLVGAADQKTILTALRKLDPPSPVRNLRTDEPPKPGSEAGKPGLPDRDKPGVGEKKLGLFGGSDKRDASPDKSVGATIDQPGQPGAKPGDRPAEDRDRMPVRVAGRRWGGCIREVDWVPQQEAPPPREKAAKLVDVVPARLRTLPIFYEGPAQLIDPEKRSGEPLAATSDNSNTQFAMLALLAASRHDVVINRSMKLLVRRFQTSQNEDGSWGYLYKQGGGVGAAPSMTCVGLIGLAVGHGIADQPMAKGKIDPAILKGFTAASGHVGSPVEDGAPVGGMPNLYVLWSIERIAVLYDLDLIGNKDWYRWASQSLVAHQKPAGNWQDGGYPTAHPVLDTCFALLVLKRVNLIRSLGGRMAIDVRVLDKAINEKVEPKKNDEPPKQAEEKVVLPTPPPAPPTQAFVTRDVSPVTPTPAPVVATPTPTVEPERSSAGWLLWLVLALVLLLVMGALVCVVVSLSRGQSEAEEEDEDEDEDEDEPEEQPRRKARPPARRR